ncbi:MAG: thiamine pyrophosphate-dependent enzyme [Chloroflexota bacterium]
MPQLTGGQAIVQSLKQHGVDTIFALPGVQLDNIFDALYDEQDNITVYHTRHEQATAYMALGYAQSTGKVGVCLVVPGPGLLNTTAALSTAYSTNTPVLAISGQINSEMIDKGLGQLHEIPNQLQMIGSVTKWACRADSPQEAPGVVREAFRQMLTGRPRPVEIEMAPDIMGMKADVELIDPFTHEDPPAADPNKLKEAAKLLGKAKNPMIFIGGGIHGAYEEVLELAETLQAPVIMSAGAKGAIDSRHYLAQTMTAGYELWMETDCALAVGTRFNTPISRWGIDDELKTIHIDIDEEEIGRLHEPTVGVVADAKAALTELIPMVQSENIKRESREEELTALNERVFDAFWEVQPQASFAQALRESLPEDGILVTEMTQMGYFSRDGFPVYHPRTFVHCGYQGTLGFGFATALGAQVGNPDKKVISINGDGGFLFTAQEMATAVHHNIPLVTIVFVDDAYGNVKRIQKNSYSGRTIASDLHNPDYVKYAEAFGVPGYRAETAEQMQEAIQKAYDHDGPSLIEVPIGEVPPMRSIAFGPQKKRGE